MPSPKSHAQPADIAAAKAAAQFAQALATKLYGAPPKALVAESAALSNLVAELSQDQDALKAAALLPYIEGERNYWRAAQDAVPQKLAKLLENLADLALIDQIQRQSSSQEHEPLRRMLLAIVNDLRCVVIKLGRHLLQLRHAKTLTAEERKAIAIRSFNLYAPLANRLGIWQIKWEIEDLAFRYLHPNTYKQLAKQLKEKRLGRERYIEEVIALVGNELAAQNITAEVLGRPKHIYSIYKKMQAKQLNFDQLYDLRAIRILVDNEPSCYMALGAIHSLWPPISSEFDDYLANPKPNGYRSIHTAVYALEGKTLEVQIRTQEIHKQAELGVAAHWRYKEGGSHDEKLNQKIGWLRELLEASQNTDDDLIPELTNQVFEDHIYVVTPAGEVIALPTGATTVDFAFQVHTEVGLRCRGARINGHIVPLNTRLNNGDQVEILTAKTANPSRDWLNNQLGYATTTKTKSRLRSWFRAQDRDDNIAAGRDIIDRELKRLGQENLPFEQLAKQLKQPSVNQMLTATGAGDITPAQLASTLQPEKAQELRILARKPNPSNAKTGVNVSGIGSLMSTLARCCRPITGDEIGGFVTRGRGVSIHRADCAKFLKLKNTEPNRIIDVSWGSQNKDDLPAAVKIEAWDRHGLLRDISSVLANDHVNVMEINSRTDTKAHKAYISVDVQVKDLAELSLICNRIAQVPNVIDVSRA